VLVVAAAHVLLQVIIGSNVDAAAAAGTSGRQTTEDWSTVLGSMFGEHQVSRLAAQLSAAQHDEA
jgi:hypothetical protein